MGRRIGRAVDNSDNAIKKIIKFYDPLCLTLLNFSLQSTNRVFIIHKLYN